MERLKFIQLLTKARKLNGLSGDAFHRQRRAAARVTIELGENGPGDA